MGWLYVPGMADLNSDVRSLVYLCESSVTLRGKPMQWRTRSVRWRSEWLQGGWIRLLSGMTLRPSLASDGVDEWISLQLGSRVSRGVRQASASAKLMSDGSGGTSTGSSAKSSRRSSFSRMCPDSSEGDSATFSGPFSDWGSQRNGEWCERATPELLIAVRGSSSSQRTPTVDDPSSGNIWPTPDAGVRVGTNGGKWGDGSHHRAKQGAGIVERPTLAALGASWPTPTATDGKGSHGEGQRRGTLSEAVEQKWPTPNVADSRASARHSTTTGVMNPGTSMTDAMRTHLDRETAEVGSSGLGRAVLNPAFVELMQGLEEGWTDFVFSGMESCPSRQLSLFGSSDGGSSDE